MHPNPNTELKQPPATEPRIVTRTITTKPSAYTCRDCGEWAPQGFGICRRCAEQNA